MADMHDPAPMGFFGRYRTPLLICFLVLAVRLPVIGAVGLGDSEAYYWTWSKHLDLSYFDHPPAVAYVIRAGTAIFGDTAFGARILPTLLATATLFVVYLAGEALAGAAAGLLSMGVLISMPLFIVGGVAAAPDSPQVLFVAFAVLFYLKARKPPATCHQPTGSRLQASGFRLPPHACVVLAGLSLGLAFLSKYSALMLIPGLLAALALPSNRHWFRRPSFYAGVLLCALCSIPVVAWNAAHDWGTLTYHFVSRQGNAGFSLTNLGKLVGGQLAYFSPFVVVGFAWAVKKAVASRRSPVASLPDEAMTKSGGQYAADSGQSSVVGRELLFELVLIGLPAVLFFYLVILVTPNAEPHWPLCGYIPLAVVLGATLAGGDLRLATHDSRPAPSQAACSLQPTAYSLRPLFPRLTVASIVFSLVVVAVAHVHILTPAIARLLPASHNPKHDLTNELYGWDVVGARIGERMAKFHGNRPFLLGYHYTFCSQLMFATGGRIETRCLNKRKDQFDFFPGAAGPFTGRDALYVRDNRYNKAPGDLYLFDRCDPGEKVQIDRAGRKVREFEMFLCHGSKGIK
ncbi:MAG: glycosyltransferase family 39 protein [Deltaproteobacteria bacterium]|nr:glycosyltransferase family 39 protein [Deltaproteobacteria bacterium]